MKISKPIFLLILLIIEGCQGVGNQSKKQGQSDITKLAKVEIYVSPDVYIPE